MKTDRTYRTLSSRQVRPLRAIARANTPSDMGRKLALTVTASVLLLVATAHHLLLSAAI